MSRNKLVLLGIILFDVMSLGILIPVLPAIFNEMVLPVISGNPQVNTVIWYSLVIGLHPIGAFFSAPYLGALSDRVGRKWVLVVSLVGTVVGYSLSVIGVQAASLLLLAIARVIDGFTAGNIAVARASLLDIAPPENRTQALGVVGALFGLGMLMGPLFGGLSWSVFGLSHSASTLVIATGISLVSMLVTVFLFRETNTEIGVVKHKMQLLPKPESELVPHIVAGVLYVVGFGIFTTYWALYLYSHFGLDAKQVSYAFVFTGLFIAVTQGVVVRYLSHFAKPRKVLLSSLPLFALAVLLLAVIPLPYLYPALAWFCLWNGLSMANRVSLISSYGAKYGQGYISGMDASYTSLAATAAPLLLGISSFFGPQVPFIVIFIVVISAWFVVHKYCFEYKVSA